MFSKIKRTAVIFLIIAMMPVFPVMAEDGGADQGYRVYGENIRIEHCGNTPDGIYMSWKPAKDADGYVICRRNGGDAGSWTQTAVLESGDSLYYEDKTDLASGKKYVYDIRPYYLSSDDKRSSIRHSGRTRVITRVERPVLTENITEREEKQTKRVKVKKTVTETVVNEDGEEEEVEKTVYVWEDQEVTVRLRDITASWQPVPGADKYIVEYSDSRYFKGERHTTAVTGTSFQITGQPYDTPCYIRVRAADGSVRSQWSYNDSASGDVTSVVSYVWDSRKKYFLDLRKAAGQKMGGYDTTQAGCIRGSRLYTVLWKKSGSKKYGRIAMWDLNKRKLIRVSKPLRLCHGNGMTYDSKTKTLVVCCYDRGRSKVLMKVDASTLRQKGSVEVELPYGLYGASDRTVDKYCGISGIAYDSSRNQYVVKLKKQNAAVVLDSSFRPLRYMKISVPKGYVPQDVFCTSDGFSLTMTGPNIIVNYDWYGNYRSTVRLNRGCELESADFFNGRLYGIAYQSYYRKKRFTRSGWVYLINRT
ncbi:MAG: hypothetical protein ACI4LM_00630 [Anaerovoracaceae bacterium]